MKEKGRLFVFTAPSGTGKTELANELVKRLPTLGKVVTTTTRPIREGEEDGKSYYFETREEFSAGIAAGNFIEHAEVYGNLYGTSKKGVKDALEKGDALLIIDMQGAEIIRKMNLGEISIFIMPPSIEELERRLKSRNTDSDEVIARRLEMAPVEMAEARNFSYTVINDDFETAINDLVSIIQGTYHAAA